MALGYTDIGCIQFLIELRVPWLWTRTHKAARSLPFSSKLLLGATLTRVAPTATTCAVIAWPLSLEP